MKTAPREDGFIPILLSAICAAGVLIISLIDKFIFPFKNELLSPLVSQIVILLIPAYVFISLSSTNRDMGSQLRENGIRPLRTKYVFFVIFSILFAVASSLILNMIFGGFYSTSKGFSLLGSFVAGENEFSSSPLYLAVVYALIPAFVEELVFRGFIFNRLKSVSLPIAALLSSLLYALFLFKPLQIPAAFFGGLIMAFVFITTNSLLSSMIVHFLYNLFAIFWQTNFSQYFITTHKKHLPVVLVIAAWLLAALLFTTEAAKIYKEKADNDSKTDLTKASRPLFFGLWQDIKALFKFKPTAIASTVLVAIYIVVSIIA